MIKIKKATSRDVEELSRVSEEAFYVPHKDVIPKNIMDAYLLNSFNKETLLKEIKNPKFQYYLLYRNEVLAGFSKIIIDTKNEHINEIHVTKMERLYLLEEFYGLGLGNKLFQYNLKLAKEQNQKGIWLYVWIKNYRAIDFYKKAGFKKIADYDFPISETETRINDVLYLELS